MILLWTVVALTVAVVLGNLLWLATPLILAFVAKDVSLEDFASGNSIPHIATNILVGLCVGYVSLFSAQIVLSYVEVQEKWPNIAICLVLLISATLSLRLRITPYSRLAVGGEIAGLITALLI